MGLFDKKICSICGGEIGLLGNRKLEDGNLCKECARKLSPWFSERRHSTVEDIKAHLAYREENQKKLAGFNPTKTFGEGNVKVMIDEARGEFIATSSRKWQDANPDIIALSQVKGCKYEIEEDEEELMDVDAGGNAVSFNPPKYEYSYEFKVTIDVDSPYFSDIEFDFSDEEPSSKEDELYKALEKGCRSLQHTLLPGIYGDPALEEPLAPSGNLIPEEIPAQSGNPVPNGLAALTEWKCPKCGRINNENFCTVCGEPRPVKWFCGKCGKENYENFCTACGNPAPADIVGNQPITRNPSDAPKKGFQEK